MSVNDATNVAAAAAFSTSSAVAKSMAKTFTNNIIAKTFQHLTRKRYKCYYGKSFDQLPNDELSELSPEILACYSGPDNGISDVSLISQRRLLQKQSTVVQKPLENGTINRSLSDVSKMEQLKIIETKKNDSANEQNKEAVKNKETFKNGDVVIPIKIEQDDLKDTNDKSKNLKQNQEPNENLKEDIKNEQSNENQIKENVKNETKVVEENSEIKNDTNKNTSNINKDNLIKQENDKSLTKETIPKKDSQDSVKTLVNEDQVQTVKTVKVELSPTESKQISPNKLKGNIITEQTLINECWDSFSRSKILKWNVPHHTTFGVACSLYENNLITKTTVGDPIADVFSVLTRQNNSIMILADGVNWGPRSRLAARSAVRASMNYLNKHIFFPNLTENPTDNSITQHKLTTHDIFTLLMKSFDVAQEYILQKKGTMTTLCASVVLKLKDSTSSSTPLWGVCTLSVGDSTAYVFNKEKGVIELTYGARNINDDRDMRNVGGALGHVYGRKPDVSNLNYSFMYIKEGDIVFLVSDGISDNFDPCVSQTAVRKKDIDPGSAKDLEGNSEKLNANGHSHNHMHRNSLISFASTALNYTKKSNGQTNAPRINQRRNPIQLSSDDQKISTTTLPQLSPNERYLCSLAHMNEVLLKRKKKSTDKITAHEMCVTLVEHVMKVTALKRNLLEKGLTEAANLNEDERQKFQANLREKSLKLRGKLDHASIVAYDVGICKK